jgi:putative DNA primase/helicase
MIPNLTPPEAPHGLLARLSSRNNSRGTGFLQPGSRNNDLASIAGLLRRLGRNQQEISRTLHTVSATMDHPLDAVEVEGIAKSISRYPTPVTTDLDDFPLSRLIAGSMATTTCYARGRGWLHYDGICWANDPNGSSARETIKCALEALVETIVQSGDIDAIKQVRKLRSASTLKRIFDLISDDPILIRDINDFDQIPGLLNLPNGTLSIADGILNPHSKDDKITRLARAEYNSSAACPVFDRFLESCLGGEERAFVLRLFGYALLGNPKEQIFAIFHGPGRNGKSTLVEAVGHLMGDYSTHTEASSFIKQRTERIRNDLARLKGVRMVAASELSPGEILDAALIKRVTGGEFITARFLNNEYFEFKPEFLKVMTTNNLPIIDGGDRALARRILLVPFPNTIAEADVDPDLPVKLQAESSGILNRLVAGAQDYLANGLRIPESLKRAAAQYLQDSDLISSFIADRCELVPQASSRARDLYQAYAGWAFENGVKPMSQGVFRAEFTKRTDLIQKRTKSALTWPGVRVLPRSLT